MGAGGGLEYYPAFCDFGRADKGGLSVLVGPSDGMIIEFRTESGFITEGSS